MSTRHPPLHRVRGIRPACTAALFLLASCSAQPSTDPVTTGASSGPEISYSTATGSVPTRLALWLQLVASPGGSARDYMAFLAQTPKWPERAVMFARMQRALLRETDMGLLAQACANQPLTSALLLMRCASVSSTAAMAPKARNAWRDGIDSASDEAGLVATFGPALTQNDERARFERQMRTGQYGAASREIARLSPDFRSVASARLALRARTPGADAISAGIASSNDAALLLDRLYWLRRAEQTDAALALWKQAGFAAEASSSLGFGAERANMARALVAVGRFADAQSLAHDTMLAPQSPAGLDAAFLSGWLDLRKLNQPTEALAAFRPLCTSSSVITQSRGHYWLGRVLAASGDNDAARAEYERAAALPTTFYGQMALAVLAGGAQTLSKPDTAGATVRARLATLSAPGWSRADVERINSSDMAQAAEILVASGDRRHAREFLSLLESQTDRTGERAALARLALRLGLPDVAIAATRHAGRNGVVLFPDGWPQPFTPQATDLPGGLALAVMRQESSFNAEIVSPAKAYGLMQLLPAAAGDVARHAGLNGMRTDASALIEPKANMTLGTAYLTQLMTRFGGTVPYVLAAYNAGPHRTDMWLASLGDPGGAHADQETMIDWIESVPFTETRDYIQRVEENMAVYQARTH